MFVVSKDDIEKTEWYVDWGNETSHRLLVEADNMGFGVCHTVVYKATESLLEYKNHLEACYCIGGSGEVEDMDGTVYPIKPGNIYVLDKHDKHYLRASKDEDLILVSVFNPALKGTEKHDLRNPSSSSTY